jgi:hypothetical protein
MAKKLVAKQDSAGAIGAARDMVSQLQEQAKNGQIDGAMLDQLEAILKVSVDAASDQQSAMQSEASGVTDVATAPSGDGSVPSDLEKTEDESTEELPTEESTQEQPSAEESSMNEIPSEIKKAAEPASARPGGTPNLQFDNVGDYERVLPDFITAMEGGHMAKAQQLAGKSTVGFDTLFNMAQRALLNEGGWVAGNLQKLGGMTSNDALSKSITASSVPGIYLIRLAKLMLPVYAGLTKRLPTDTPKQGGTEAVWRAQLGFGSTAEVDFFRIAEAAIGVEPDTDFLTFNAPYNDLSVNDSVTLKALRTSAGYSDPLQIGVIKAMSALLRGQERVVLGGNRAKINAPDAPTLTCVAVASTTLANGSFCIGISALTYEGWVNGSKGGLGTVVGETAATFGTNYVVCAAGSSIKATWKAIPGAVAYNIYMSGSSAHISGSSSHWHAQTKLNTYTISDLGGQASGSHPLSADTTVNATYGMEGIIPWCSGSGMYTNPIPNKQNIYDNAGAALTAGNGGIEQYDSILADIWTNWHTAPSLMVMSPNMNADLVGKLQSLGSGNFYRIEVGAERNAVNGGLMVSGYVNKFAPFADGTPRMIDVMPHPYMPDGTVLFLSETIPYPMGNETRGWVRDVLLPYTYFPLPSQAAGVNKIRYDFAIATSEVIECFNPGPQAALVCVDHTA